MAPNKEIDQARTPVAAPVKRWAGILIGTVVAHGVLTLATWGSLPARIPLHFDASGAPDRIGPPTAGAWFGPFFVSALVSLFIGIIALSIPRIPSKYLSLPRKREFLALDTETRRRLLGIIATHTLVLATTMAVVFAVLQALMYLTSIGRIGSFPAWIVFAAMALMIIEIVIMVVSFSRGLDAELGARGGRR